MGVEWATAKTSYARVSINCVTTILETVEERIQQIEEVSKLRNSAEMKIRFMKCLFVKKIIKTLFHIFATVSPNFASKTTKAI